jgi:cytochrome c-type biogenesis protein
MEFLLPFFDWLSRLLTLSPGIVLAGAFLWGVLSIILSPCHLSAVPLAVGYINGQGKKKMSRTLVLSLLFAAGVLVSLSLIGVITSFLGRMLGDTGKVTTIIIGIIFILMGVLMFDFIKLPEIPFWKAKIKTGSLSGALLLGLLFGAALGPCTFGFMMPVLSTAFQAAATSLPLAMLIVLFFSLGHTIVIVFAGMFINWVQGLLKWNEKSKGLVWFRRACGVLIIVTGCILIFS